MLSIRSLLPSKRSALSCLSRCTQQRLAVMVGLLGLPLTYATAPAQGEAMQVGFLWHMHQPTYRPGQDIMQTENSGDFSFSVVDVHNQRFGPYNAWPRNAIQSGLSLPNLGASVSFSGSLIRNLNSLEANNVNGGMWNNWEGAYQQAAQWQTSEGNARLDLVNFGFNHPLMPLLDRRDIRMQIKLQKRIHEQTWGPNVPFSKGIFPPETAFSSRIIPALVEEGIEWTIVDSIHMERAVENYPHTNSSNLYAPNKADQINPAIPDNQWIQLNNLWAPSKVAAPFAYRPHYTQYVDPATGEISKIVAVPGARYEGNEDGRGGYGALQYQTVMDQYKQFNTDPNHPMFVLLHHDGDNFGGGSEAYYHGNFNNMVNWANSNADYNVTTIQDYLDRFPVNQNDVIHIESGSWAGADNGDPEFKKWLGDPDANGWSPDRNSWAVLIAAKNRVHTADDIAPHSSLDNIINGTGSSTERAWHALLQAQASDHWYWDGTEVWDSNVTRGSNIAVGHADQVISNYTGSETTGPTVFVPQREAYNPGGYEWGSEPEPSDFEIWTLAYDVSGLSAVDLMVRVDLDGVNPLNSTQNETYAGGNEVGPWNRLPMTASDLPVADYVEDATYRAQRYGAMVEGYENVLLDYYVHATDNLGNETRTDIQHVWVGSDGTLTSPTGFSMDGVLDADVPSIAENNGRHLYAEYQEGQLYLATEDAGEGQDVFIYIAREPGTMESANWAKSGQVAGHDGYLADENDNDYEAWFGIGSILAATAENGGVLEGVIDLAAEFGELPEAIYVAVGLFDTADGGGLISSLQVPAALSNDGSIQASEFIRIDIPAAAIPEPAAVSIFSLFIGALGCRRRRS